jgi:hypothetical protein
MFKSRKFPLGWFQRTYLDWSFDQAMACEVESVSGGSSFPLVSLYNDATSGSSMMIVGVLAWASTTPPLVYAYLAAGINGVANGTPTPVSIPAASYKGTGYASSTASNLTPPPIAKFIADGRTWFAPPGGPVAILAPGYRLELFTGQMPNGDIVRPSTLIATFLWIPA